MPVNGGGEIITVLVLLKYVVLSYLEKIKTTFAFLKIPSPDLKTYVQVLSTLKLVREVAALSLIELFRAE